MGNFSFSLKFHDFALSNELLNGCISVYFTLINVNDLFECLMNVQLNAFNDFSLFYCMEMRDLFSFDVNRFIVFEQEVYLFLARFSVSAFLQPE